MNRDDESLLSAFLDGELSTSDRLRIETALLADPRLAERLQELAAVRSLVSGLPRPTVAVDLASAVCSRIEAGPGFRLRRAWRSTPRRTRTLAGGAVLAAAAALTVALAPSFRPPPKALPVAVAPVPVLPPVRPVPEVVAGPVAPLPAVPAAPAAAPESRLVAAPGLDDPRELADREQFRTLLDSPSVRRITIVVDSLSPGELARVEGALSETGRARPLRGEVRIGQGITIDPEHPGEAVVYVVVMDGREVADFRENLRRQSPDGDIQEAEAPPEIVTQLADIGQVIITEGRAVPELQPAPIDLEDALALRHPAAESVAPARPGPNGNRPAGETFADPPPADTEQDPRDPEVPPRRVYLVWVTPRTAGRP